jgi:hypothetical protein
VLESSDLSVDESQPIAKAEIARMARNLRCFILLCKEFKMTSINIISTMENGET